MEGHEIEKQSLFGVWNATTPSVSLGFSILIDYDIIRIDETYFRVGCEHRGCLFESRWRQQVITVNPSEIRGGGFGDGRCQGIHPSFVFSLDQSASPVLGAIKGACVCLKRNRRTALAKLIPLLDGRAGSVLLLPRGIPDVFIQEYYQDIGVEAEVDLKGDEVILDRVAGASRDQHGSGDATKWIIPTSGTTGKPKLVAHTHASLTRSVKADIDRGAEFRWGLAYDINRFAGLQVYLQSLLSGSSLLIPDEEATVRQMRGRSDNGTRQR